MKLEKFMKIRHSKQLDLKLKKFFFLAQAATATKEWTEQETLLLLEVCVRSMGTNFLLFHRTVVF